MSVRLSSVVVGTVRPEMQGPSLPAGCGSGRGDPQTPDSLTNRLRTYRPTSDSQADSGLAHRSVPDSQVVWTAEVKGCPTASRGGVPVEKEWSSGRR